MSDRYKSSSGDKSQKRRIPNSPGDPSPPNPTQRLRVPAKKSKHTYEDEITFSDITYHPSSPARAPTDDELPQSILSSDMRQGSRMVPSAKSAYMIEDRARERARSSRDGNNKGYKVVRSQVDHAASEVPPPHSNAGDNPPDTSAARVARFMSHTEEDVLGVEQHPLNFRQPFSPNPFEDDPYASYEEAYKTRVHDRRIGASLQTEERGRMGKRSNQVEDLDVHNRRAQKAAVGFKSRITPLSHGIVDPLDCDSDGPIQGPRSHASSKMHMVASTMRNVHKTEQVGLNKFSIHRGRRSVSPDNNRRERLARRSPSWGPINGEDTELFTMDEELYDSARYADADDAVDQAINNSVNKAMNAATNEAVNIQNSISDAGIDKNASKDLTEQQESPPVADTKVAGSPSPYESEFIRNKLDDYIDEDLPPLSHCDVRQQFPQQSNASSSASVQFMDLVLMAPDLQETELLMIESAHNFELSVPYANLAICKPYAFDLEPGTNRLIWNNDFVSRTDNTIRTDKARNVVGIMIGQVRHPNLKKAVSLSFKTFYLSRRLGICPTEMALNRIGRLMATKLQWPAVKLSYDKGSIINFSVKGSSALGNATASPASSRYTRPAKATADGGSATLGAGFYPTVLDFTADVKVYDARNTDFRFTKEHLDKLHSLPEYTSFTEDKDLNCRCVVAVGYTMNAWGIPAERPVGYAQECPSISTNIQFAIVLAVLPFD